MRKLRGDADLAKESFGADRSAELLLQDFDGDFALVLLLLGEVNCRHAAVAEEALDRVAVGERVGEGDGGVAHGRNIARERIAVPQPRRLKNCTARSCFFAAAKLLKVPRLRRRPVLGFTFRE